MTRTHGTVPGATEPRAVFLMGPTATGKTDLAVRLAHDGPFEIVSVDSALVYRGMDIGTAKPDTATRACVPHHLIDICDPADAYSAGRFSTDALRVMGEITARGRIPLLVGGTMLYFRALQQGLSPLPTASAEVRAQIEARAIRDGWERLHAELARIDPVAAARIHPNDPQRIQRALEVHAITGRALSDHFSGSAHEFPYVVAKIALVPADRGEIHRRVAQRFRAMLDQGLIDEVRGLRARGDLHPGLPSMRAVGYRQVWDYLDHPTDLQTLIDRAVIATRQLAKRQLTWLRAESGAWMVDPFTADSESGIRQFLQTQLG